MRRVRRARRARILGIVRLRKKSWLRGRMERRRRGKRRT